MRIRVIKGQYSESGLSRYKYARPLPAQGPRRWRFLNRRSSLGIAYSDMPAVADFDSDGMPEILPAGTVLDGQSDAVKATFPVKYSPSWWREVLAADIDDDGTLEIVSATRAFEADCTMIADTGLSGTFPAIAGLDLDGKYVRTRPSPLALRHRSQEGGRHPAKRKHQRHAQPIALRVQLKRRLWRWRTADRGPVQRRRQTRCRRRWRCRLCGLQRCQVGR